jgi:ATP-dependent RNA helicase SUPV3L1/SUV3
MPPVIALLGPTNTGKTFHAMERLAAHETGMIGFPLRLLARENYDRLAALKGTDAVALVTGEERVIPPGARYFVCTVEAMPLDRMVDFVAVDEVQLAADRERGHVFTDRVLHARGRSETMLLGAETARPLLRSLVREAAFLGRPRLSTLSYAEPRKLARLPRRTAIVAFSLAGVYEVAERMRRETGGAAVVFGALSPRTRNAQVALYQAGDVDYLVATDAIGMGLNLDIDHVAFTGLRKHDGRGPRELTPAEVAQIAGRAGRHTRDGTFGATTDLGPLDAGLVEAVESHHFQPLGSVMWRNSDLSFASPRALLQSLEERPPSPQLVRMRDADDHRALAALAAEPEVAALARDPGAVRLLWEVCQVPDFRNVMTEAHTRLLGQVFRRLRGPRGHLEDDWVDGQVAALDRVDGDLDQLLARIAHIRTWTYVSHRDRWTADPRHWQARTRAVEDRLSDALHQRLTEEFVDRRAAVVARYDPDSLEVEVAADGELFVQGLSAGRLVGFRYEPDPSLREEGNKLRAAANRALRTHIVERVDGFESAADEALAWGPAAQVLWRGAPVARLAAGEDALAPRVEPLASDLLEPHLKERVRRRVAAWVSGDLGRRFASLQAVAAAPLGGPGRGLVFALREGLGSAPRRDLRMQVAALSPEERRELARRGVRLGRHSLFLPDLLRSEVIPFRALLWRVHQGAEALPAPRGELSVPADPRTPAAFLRACGYEPVAGRAVRVDALERFTAAVRRAAERGPVSVTPETASLVGCGPADAAALLERLGFERSGPATVKARPARQALGPRPAGARELKAGVRVRRGG